MAWSLRISWENGQPRASFSHFMWTKPEGRQTNICTFKTIITWGKSPLSWGRSPLPSPCCDCINFFLPAYCEKQPGIRLCRSLVEFCTEQSKVQGIWDFDGFWWFEFFVKFSHSEVLWKFWNNGKTPQDRLVNTLPAGQRTRMTYCKQLLKGFCEYEFFLL